MSRLPGRSALRLVAALTGMAATGSLGWYAGLQAGTSTVEAGVLAARSEPAADELSVRLVRERDAARTSLSVMRDRLAEAEQRRADDAAELALYRRLGDRATGSGLGIEAVEWRHEAGRDLLDIVLVQAKGRRRVSGTVGIALLDESADPPLIEIAPEEGEAAPRFDLRFFQTVSVPVDPLIATPDTTGGKLSISVVPNGVRHPAFVDIRDWGSIISPGAVE